MDSHGSSGRSMRTRSRDNGIASSPRDDHKQEGSQEHQEHRIPDAIEASNQHGEDDNGMANRASAGDAEESNSPAQEETEEPADTDRSPAKPLDRTHLKRAVKTIEPQTGSKRKRPSYSGVTDEAWLEDATRQWKKLRLAKNSLRSERKAVLVPLLYKMELLPSDQMLQDVNAAIKPDGEEADAYLLDVADAKKLLASTTTINAPIFVPNGARPLFENDEGKRRPMEQALNDWYIDAEELSLTDDLSQLEGTERKVTIARIRERFFSGKEGEIEYPFNIPDIRNPLAQQAVPEFVQSLNCNFLFDLVRHMFDNDDDDVCQDNCPNRPEHGGCCEDHQLTVTGLTELTELHGGWDHWMGALMIAEPGANTNGHWDKYSFGTWKACHEGQIGFCWHSHPDEKQRTLWQGDGKTLDGRYLFKVVRPGEALSMPPGTVHFVFRMPNGPQTLATAGHILRRSCVDQWLETFRIELGPLIEDLDILGEEGYAHLTAPLVRSAKHMVEIAAKGSEKEINRLGGPEGIEKARAAIEKLEAMVVKIVERVAQNEAAKKATAEALEEAPEETSEEVPETIPAPKKAPRKKAAPKEKAAPKKKAAAPKKAAEKKVAADRATKRTRAKK